MIKYLIIYGSEQRTYNYHKDAWRDGQDHTA
jgi:hypothetical protein